MKYICYIFILFLSMFSASVGAQSLAQEWISFPQELTPTIEPNRRMDMVDLYNAGQKATVTTRLGGTAELTALGSNYMSIKLSECNTLQIKKFTGEKDSIFVVIHTITAPAANSRLEIYDKSWHRLTTSKYLALPTLDDFIVPPTDNTMSKKEIKDTILIPTFRFIMNEATDEIAILPTFEQTLDQETYKRIKNYILPQKSIKPRLR